MDGYVTVVCPAQEEKESASLTWDAAVSMGYDAPGTTASGAWGADTSGILRDGTHVAWWASCCYPDLLFHH